LDAQASKLVEEIAHMAAASDRIAPPSPAAEHCPKLQPVIDTPDVVVDMIAPPWSGAEARRKVLSKIVSCPASW
jgi:hypothetical protein